MFGYACLPLVSTAKSMILNSYGKLTFPRFHRHLHKWENEEIGGQNEYEDTTVVYGGV